MYMGEYEVNRIPGDWKQIIGIDFGVAHPTAMAWVAVDPNSGDMICYDEYREGGRTVGQHYIELGRHGKIPIVWPHDGNKRNTVDGRTTMDVYRSQGISTFLGQPFSNPQGGNRLEGGLLVMNEMLKKGKLKISSKCQMLLGEMDRYSREKGVVQAKEDDLCSALRYAVLSADRFAQPTAENFRSEVYSYRSKDHNPTNYRARR